MIILLFSCFDPNGGYHEFSLGDLTLEVCLEAVTTLVQDGWKIQAVKLAEPDQNSIVLPAEAFDGTPLLQPMRDLEREWTTILSYTKQ